MTQTQPACCPQCGSSEAVLTAREAFEAPDGSRGGPSAWEAAPPPAPAPAPAANTASTVLLVVGGLILLRGLYTAVAPEPDLAQFSDSYQAGYRMGGIVIAAIPLLIGGLLRVRATTRAERAGSAARARWQQQMAVWEQARLCTACRAAFWPDGVLTPAIPASPLIPLHQFPLTVVTMAERAHGC